MKASTPRALPPVFVLNTYYTGIGIARNLRDHGVPVYGLSSEDNAPGVRSRFFKGIYSVPNGRDEPQALCRRLIELRKNHDDAPVIFPTRDFDVLFLHRHRRELSPWYRFPQNDAVECLLDKLELFKIASSDGIAVPATVVCSSVEEIHANIAKLRFPLVVKPRMASDWRRKGTWEAVGARKAFLVESTEQLVSEYSQIASVNAEVMIQEYIQGSDSDIAVCCCYIDSKQEMPAYFTARKLRQNPPLFGTGCAVETVDISEIVPEAKRLLRACRYTGLAEVEFKRDSSSGKWLLIEVNPRHWDQHEIGAHIGVNLSWVAYQEMIGRSVASEPAQYQLGNVRWIAESEALMLMLKNAYVQVQENRRHPGSLGVRLRRHYGVLRALMRETAFLLKGRTIFAIFDRRDPAPGILLCIRTVRELSDVLMRRMLDTWRTRHATVD
jgi:D-aspartate ligase